jgi:hypothetical protein
VKKKNRNFTDGLLKRNRDERASRKTTGAVRVRPFRRLPVTGLHLSASNVKLLHQRAITLSYFVGRIVGKARGRSANLLDAHFHEEASTRQRFTEVVRRERIGDLNVEAI